jgi:thiol-disulfide isomerase/thioredoxin
MTRAATKRLFGVGLLLLAGLAAAAPAKTAAEAPPKVELKAVKYNDLARAIRALQGKVVVVDFWASWCGPCKKEFPHLVELSKKYGKDGLVAVSASVDTAEDAKDALEFLQKAGATFPNYRIEESDAVWQPKLRFKSVPAVFVFDRQGYRAAKFTNDDPKNQFTYTKNVIPLVLKLLDQK